MRLDENDVLHAKSVEPWIWHEESGAKPFTIRRCSQGEKNMISLARSICIYDASDDSHSFTRKITEWWDVTVPLDLKDTGDRFVIIQWKVTP